MTAEQFLRELFGRPLTAARVGALAYEEVGTGLPVKPWWPPLSEVWHRGADVPADWPGQAQAWHDARALVVALHDEWEAARGADAG